MVPPEWGIASSLRETADSSTFTAANYDELVDAPTVLGSFDRVRFEVDGKPHFVVTIPAGGYSAANVAAFVQMLPKIIRAERAIFGSLPYDKYVFFYFSPTTEFAGGALELVEPFAERDRLLGIRPLHEREEDKEDDSS